MLRGEGRLWFRSFSVCQIGSGYRSFTRLHFLFLRHFLRLTHTAQCRTAKHNKLRNSNNDIQGSIRTVKVLDDVYVFGPFSVLPQSSEVIKAHP